MNTKDLIKIVSKNCDIPETTASHAIDTILGAITESLKKRESVRLTNFGTFTLTKKVGKIENIMTGEIITVYPKKEPVFRPNKTLKDLLAKSEN